MKKNTQSMTAAAVLLVAALATTFGFSGAAVVAAGTGEDAAATASFGALAPELVGKWQYRAGGGETDFTGKSRYRSHRQKVYRFAASGAFEFGFFRDTLTILQCEIKELKYATGTASSSGSTLTLDFGAANFAGSNSCEGGQTEEKTLPAETVRVEYRLRNDEATGARQLCLREADGETCYDKAD